ncbi:hypothetical protein BGX31_000759 [Mortierella sp. GBA43]|nr:hypothetical protein BGX31_000759 [Mortierella sp. GBA43]
MAVGVWYLSTLLTLALAYTILNVFYIVNTDYIYEQHMQALDLCMRITIGPIFFLPAPAFLLRFYRERFQKMKANSGSGRNGSGNRNGGSSNHYNGSFTNSAVNNTNVSPEGTQVGSRFGTTGESSVTRCSQDNNQDNKPQDKLQKGQEPTSPSGTYSRFKLFQSRERGPSVESRRMLNKDFDCESVDSHQQPSEPRAHSFQTYQNLNNNGDRELRATPLYDPLRNEDLLLSGETLRVPEPALTGEHLQAERSITPTGWKDVETRPKGLAGSRKGSETTVHQLQVSTDDTLRSEGTGKTHDQPDTVTGSTGWEVGGHGARKSEDAPKLGQISNDTNPAQDAQQPSSGGFSHLTGLQRQLAEHRSALLPRVIAYQAYHEDLTSGEPFEPKLKPINPYDLSASRQGTSEANMGQTVDSSKRADDQVGGSLFEAEPQSPTHLVDPTHWSLSPSSQTWTGTDSGVTSFNTPGGSKSRESKSKEGLMAAFSKALNSKDKGSNKDHGPSSQTRSNSDAKDRGTKNGGDSAFELSSTPIAPTVGELAQLSTRVRAGESSKLQTNYDYDPYDEQPGFRRFRDSIRQDPIDGSIHESKGSSTSIATKGGSTPSLGSSKSRDSLSKNNATKESQGRPISPPKKSSSRSTPRATRSKSDGAFSEGIESPRTPTVEMPMNATRLMSAAVAAATAPPPVASPTSDILDFPPSPMVKTSLSPPPRQSWRRTSKNFKNVQPPIIPIDTTVGDGEPMPYIETLTSAPINGIITIPSPAANSPPSHPLQTSGQRGNSPDYSSNDWSRVSREREMTTQMSPRRASSRRQKSADNMASSYYYKRASELTNSGSRASFGTDSSSGENHSRASSFNSRILADDSWTQAMINRAQTKTKPSPSLPSAQQQQQRDLNDLNRDRENRAVSPVYNTYRRPSVGRATTE